MKALARILVPLMAFGLFYACSQSDKNFKAQLEKVIKDNPAVITNFIKEHPADVIESLQMAARDAQMAMMQKQQDEQKKELENAYANPLKPNIRNDEAIKGNKSAPITIVEYSDFECPYCGKAAKTVQDLLAKYGDKIRLVYKHVPLNFHEHAMVAAQYFEAIRLQSAEKAFKYHDEIMNSQKNLAQGTKYLDSVAKKLGVDMAKLQKDLNSDEVKKRIEEDQKEASSFGIQGTPGFVLNGIPIRGAYPLEHFESVIQELQKRGNLKL